jgi:hypothetical protein
MVCLTEALCWLPGLLQAELKQRYTLRLDAIDVALDTQRVETFGPKRD